MTPRPTYQSVLDQINVNVRLISMYLKTIQGFDIYPKLQKMVRTT